MKYTILSIVISMVVLIGIAAPAMAFPHASKDISFTISNGEQRKITLILGHTREPTFALAPGIHDGAHHVQLIIRDTATSLPITNAKLSVDRYYFKNEGDYNSGDINRARIERNIPLHSVYGLRGEFTVREILTHPGIYGYRIHGTVTYFDNTIVNIDETRFCSQEGMRGTQGPYDTSGWRGGYGCTHAVRELYWPPVPPGRDIPTAISWDNALLPSIALGTAAIGGVIATRILRKRNN